MDNQKDKFIISKLRGEDGYTNVSTRLPNSLADTLDEICAKTNRNRNQVIIRALEYAFSKVEVTEVDDNH